MRGKELPLNRRGIEAAQSEKKPGRFGSRILGLSNQSSSVAILKQEAKGVRPDMVLLT